MTPYTGEGETIAKIGTTPQERGMDTPVFEAQFSKDLKEFVEWFNDTHKTEFDAHPAENVTGSNGAHGLKIETGQFTPFITGVSGLGTFEAVYSTQNGRYQKISNRYFFDIDMQLSSYTGKFSGAFRIGGLPAPLALQSAAGITTIENCIFDSNAEFLALTITGTTIAVNQIRDNNTVVGTTTANLGQNFHIRCYGEYLAAA